MADQLTKAQEMAAAHPGGPILVAAAAGSGKTKVLVERLMRQILRRDEACSVDDFLIITFTKKAAAELREKIARELAERLAEDPENVHLQRQQSRIYLAQISTIHAFCGDLLREFAYELDIPADFRMIEETESAALREQIADRLLNERYESIGEDPDLQTLVDGLGAGRDDRQIPQLLMAVYGTAQCRLYPDRWLDWCAQCLDLEGVEQAEQTIWGRYLLEGFRREARDQAEALDQILDQIRRSDALQKYVPLFAANRDDIRALAECTDWDSVRKAAEAGLDPGRLPAIRDCGEPELQARGKAIRAVAIDRIRQWFAEFYGDSAQVLSDLRQTAAAMKALFSLTREFASRYAAEKQRLHGMDFNDLEHRAVQLLLEPDGVTPTPIARRVSQRYRQILVDEYQDTNQVQDSLFRAISRAEQNLFMVGDVKQSIYRFRLADPGIFLQKYRDYPDAETVPPDARQRILLSHNFRSGPGILSAVNDIFRLCMSETVGGLDYGNSEALRPGLPDTAMDYPQVELHCLSTKQDAEDADTPDKNRAEAEFAARRVRELLDSRLPVREKNGRRPVEPGDVVILLRSPRNTAGLYLDALRARGIPAVSDTGESILDTAEVETLLCVLKVLDNVHRDVPLAGAMLSPLFGLTGNQLSQARSPGGDQGLYDAMCRVRDREPAIDRALTTLDALRALARELPLHALLEQLQQQTGLEAIYGAMPNGPVRLSNLQTFYELAFTYAEGGRKSLHQFLQYVELLRSQGGITAREAKTNAVTVMSIHKSKGLEFPVVLLCGLSRRFNLEDLHAQVQFHSDLGAGCNVYDAATHTRFASIAKRAIDRQTRLENVSEEMRILYVAMTRPHDLLIMTYCSGNLERKLTNLSNALTPETARRLAAGAGCMGDWVLEAALLRSEAGELHARAGRPEGVFVPEDPWVIRWHDEKAGESPKPEPDNPEPPVPEDLSDLTAYLDCPYPHPAAVGVPAKLTATQLKGRFLDQEADDGRQEPARRPHSFRKPSLLRTEKPLTPAQRGTAVHQAMQYLDFDRVGSLAEIEAQLDRMVRDAFLTRQQAEAVDPNKLYRVFQGPLGEMIRTAEQVIREFKFSILTDAARYFPEAAGEELMLQGVTDCCLIRKGEITVIDFKTDRVTPGREAETAEKYRPQITAYSEALSRIYQCPVTRRILYFFSTDTPVDL